ncbi:type I-E CRISPR-associated protein Cas5/CasD [Nocardia tengchongensis]|uniref:type I-E CRISPR-associated protein Cas5/CasD n=1 Tax=Nocardia tengchongensis TaxID=2055889 RepID=UPI0036BCB619
MTGILLRLAGPLQSWGERSAFTDRDTQMFPTRSGLIGMVASACGQRREDSPAVFSPLQFTVRIDRPGTVITDFHTIGGGYAQSHTPLTAEGKRRGAGKGTIVTRRRYLSDATFTVAIEGPGDLLDQVSTALKNPRWQPYLGRRSCPPEFPLVIRTHTQDPVGDLRNKVPLLVHRRPPTDRGVDFVADGPAEDGAHTELFDVPESFDSARRRYSGRLVNHCRHTDLPKELWHTKTSDFQQALYEYMQEPA